MLNIIMPKHTQFIRVVCDVSCVWSNDPPSYRAYVDRELFAERTWIWNGEKFMLEESFQIEALPGKYKIKYELLDPQYAQLEVNNFRIEYGQATVNALGELTVS